MANLRKRNITNLRRNICHQFFKFETKQTDNYRNILDLGDQTYPRFLTLEKKLNKQNKHTDNFVH